MSNTHAPHTVRDALSFHGDVGALRAPIIRIVDQNSQELPHVQVLAAAGALVAMCDAAGIDPHDVVSRIRRMERAIDGPFTYVWQTVRDYTRGELLS